MKAFLGTALSVIAVGVLLIAYGLLAPRAGAVPAYRPVAPAPVAAFDPQTGTYRVARPIPANEQLEIGSDGRVYAVTPHYDAAPAYAPQYVETPGVVTYAPPARPVTVASTAPARQTVRRTAAVERGRGWKKSAMVIGGTTAAGAGVGAIFGGKKGALIGAAIGGGAGTLYEVKQR
jgi:hypothetical protein